jgi:hypothetical protein
MGGGRGGGSYCPGSGGTTTVDRVVGSLESVMRSRSIRVEIDRGEFSPFMIGRSNTTDRRRPAFHASRTKTSSTANGNTLAHPSQTQDLWSAI